MYFEAVFSFYVLLYHFVGHSFFGLIAFRSFSNIIKWNFSLTLAKLNFYVDMSVWLFVGKQYYRLIVSVNNDDAPAGMHLAAGNCTAYIGALSGEKVSVQDGHINITQPANSGEIWVPDGTDLNVKPVKMETKAENKTKNKTESEAKTNTENKAASETSTDAKGNQESEPKIESKDTVAATESADAKKNTTDTEKNTAADTPVDPETITVDWSKSPESMTVPELQAAILAKLAGNGPVDAQMKKTVTDNIWHDSLVNWLKSFR